MGYGVRWWPNPPPGLAPFIEPSPMNGASIPVRTAAVGLRVRITPVGWPGLVRAVPTSLVRMYRGGSDELDTRHSQPAGAQVGGVLPRTLAARQRDTQHAWGQLHRRAVARAPAGRGGRVTG